jgi:hypothetical protein
MRSFDPLTRKIAIGESPALPDGRELLGGDSLTFRMEQYRNTAQFNEDLYREFTMRIDAVPFLKAHRDWVEKNKWGFGDRAFHYMWLLIVDHLCTSFGAAGPFLEIGVYKGQVLSAIALCAEQFGRRADLCAISPFTGNRPRSRIAGVLRRCLQPEYRRSHKLGNLYDSCDYLGACRVIFEAFGLDFDAVTVLRGLSSDPAIYEQVRSSAFAAIYIDGDHSFEGVRTDLLRYSPLIRAGGLLIMDDASCEVPGKGYFKGHPEVSRAAEMIPSLGFRNILNCGHNRIYVRLE